MQISDNCEAAQNIKAFIDNDLNKIDKLIEENPIRMTVKTTAQFLNVDEDSVRAAIECGAFGFAWRKAGKVSKAYCVPTAQFVRWYLGIDVLEGVYKGSDL